MALVVRGSLPRGTHFERMSSSFDSISQTINSTFDFENFSKVALTKDTQLDKILLESGKNGLGLDY